jgi:hypothetical protein
MKLLVIVALILAIASCMFADVEASKQGAVSKHFCEHSILK